MIAKSPMLADQQIVTLAEQSLLAVLEQGDWCDSLVALDQLQKLIPGDNRFIVLYAHGLCAQAKFAEAKLKLAELSNQSFSSSGLFFVLGEIALNSGELSKSVSLFSRAIESNYGSFIDASIQAIYKARAAALAKLKLESASQADLNMVRLLEPLKNARNLYLLGRPALARKNLEELPIRVLGQHYVTMLLVRCHLAEQNYSQASELINTLSINSNGCKSALYYKAVTSYFKKQLSQCVADLSALIDSDCEFFSVESFSLASGLRICDDIDARLMRAKANISLGRMADSLQDLDYILLRRPTWQAHCERSRAAFELALFDTAMADAQAALAINPENVNLQNQFQACVVRAESRSLF